MREPALPQPDAETPGVLALVTRLAPLLLLAVTTGAAILRVFDLGDKSLWFDEAVLYWIADGSPGEVLEENAARNSAPPLFALLLSGIMRFGATEATLRLISCAAGIAVIPAVYALARRYMAAPWALFGALLVALSPEQVAFSQQVREYSLTVLLSVLLLLATQAFLDRPGTRQTLALGIVTTVALLTQYGLALLLAALGLVSLIVLARSRPPREVWLRWAGVQAVGLATVAAVIAPGLRRQLEIGMGGVLIRASYLEGGYWDRSLASLPHLVVTRSALLSDLAFPGPLFGFLWLVGIAAAARGGRSRMALSLFIVPVAVTLAAALVHVYPYTGYRQVLFLTPMFYVMAATGAAALGSLTFPWQRAAIGGLILAAQALVALRTYYWADGPEALRPLVAELLERRQPADDIYVTYRSSPAFTYYLRQNPLPHHSGVHLGGDPAPGMAQLDSLLASPTRIWLVFSDSMADRRQLLLSRVRVPRRIQLVREFGPSSLHLVE